MQSNYVCVCICVWLCVKGRLLEVGLLAEAYLSTPLLWHHLTQLLLLHLQACGNNVDRTEHMRAE